MSKRKLQSQIRGVLIMLEKQEGFNEDGSGMNFHTAHEMINHVINDYFRSEGLE